MLSFDPMHGQAKLALDRVQRCSNIWSAGSSVSTERARRELRQLLTMCLLHHQASAFGEFAHIAAQLRPGCSCVICCRVKAAAKGESRMRRTCGLAQVGRPLMRKYSLPMCSGTALLVGGGSTLLDVQLYYTVRLAYAGVRSHGLCYGFDMPRLPACLPACLLACLPACLGTEDVCGQPAQRWSGASSSFGDDIRASCQSAAAKDGSSAPSCVRDVVVGLVRRPLAPMR